MTKKQLLEELEESLAQVAVLQREVYVYRSSARHDRARADELRNRIRSLQGKLALTRLRYRGFQSAYDNAITTLEHTRILLDRATSEEKVARALVDDLVRDRDEALRGLEALRKERDYLRTDRDYFFSRKEAAVAEVDRVQHENQKLKDEIERLKAVGKKESERILHKARAVEQKLSIATKEGNQRAAELASLRSRIAALTAPATITFPMHQESRFAFNQPYQ